MKMLYLYRILNRSKAFRIHTYFVNNIVNGIQHLRINSVTIYVMSSYIIHKCVCMYVPVFFSVGVNECAFTFFSLSFLFIAVNMFSAISSIHSSDLYLTYQLLYYDGRYSRDPAEKIWFCFPLTHLGWLMLF